MAMFYACVGFALAAAGLCARWVVVRSGSTRDFPAISVGFFAVLAVLASVPVVVRLDLDARLGRDASRLIGVHVTVDCQTLTGSAIDMGSELGYVRWGPGGKPEQKTLIKHQQCNDLESYLDSNKRHPTPAQVLAVHVLTHESMHMSGVTSEAIAECDAMQRDTQMAEIMGASPQAAHELAVRYWKIVYPNMPDGYTSSECRAGGALDLQLADPPWAS